MTTGTEIAKTAEEWVGTPFRHQAWQKGIATDCVGLVRGVAEEHGLAEGYGGHHRYPRTPTGQLKSILDEYLDEVNGEIEAGDVIVFNIGLHEHHLGLYVGSNKIVHAREQVGKVVINTFGNALKSKMVAAYRFRGLE